MSGPSSDDWPPHLITGWWERVKSFSRQEQPLEWAEAMFHLGNALQEVEVENRAENVELAILAYGKALAVRTRDAHRVLWAETMVNLANAWSRRARGDPGDNRRRAVQFLEGAVDALDPATEAESWGLASYNLGTTLLERRNDEPADVARAIAVLGDALSVFDRESRPEYWAAANLELARAQLRRRDDPGAGAEMALDAVLAAKEVHDRRQEPGPWADLMHQLGVCYLRRQLGDAADNVEQAIACFEDALEVRPHGSRPEFFADSKDGLGTAYLRRHRGDRAANVERAIRCYRGALEVRLRERLPEAWAATTVNLATAYRNRIRGDWAENLELARRGCLEALEVHTRDRDPQKWATAQMNLGIIYGHRVRGDPVANLELAIRSYEAALEVWTPEAVPEDWALTSMNLGTAYSKRRQGDPAENVERAIAAFRGSLQVRTREATPVDWSLSMAQLGAALAKRRRGDPAADAAEAIAALEAALTVQTRDAMPYLWLQTYGNLGAALTWLAEGDRRERLERARGIFAEILEAVDPEDLPLEWAQFQHNLGQVHCDLRRLGGDERDVAAAVDALGKALKIYSPELLPVEARRSAHQLGDLCAREGRWTEAAGAYRTALTAAETIYRASVLIESRQTDLASVPELERRAAYALAHTGDLEGALVALERGRARSSREILERDQADLEALNRERPDLVTAFRAAAGPVRDFEAQQRSEDLREEPMPRRFVELYERARALGDDLDDAIRAIRAVPGYERFLDLPGREEISRAVAARKAWLHLVITDFGSVALFARCTGNSQDLALEAFWHDRLITADLDDLLVERHEGQVTGGYLLDPFRLGGDPSAGGRSRFERRLTAANTALGAWLGPLIRELRRRGVRDVSLVANGRLALLPLHAARVDPGHAPCLLDEIGIRYVPSVRVADLVRRSRPAQSTVRRLVAVSHAGSGAGSLPYAASEIAAVVAVHPHDAVVLSDSDATLERLEGALAGATHLHLACHGGFELANPLESGLDLSDGRWTLRRILELAPRLASLRLVVLSACHTGLSEWDRLPDELIGLPAAFLQAGVPGVVATLWPAEDLATVLLMEAFYQRLFAEEPLPPDVALRQAQLDLRELEVSRLDRRFRGRSARAEQAPPDPLAPVWKEILGRLRIHGLAGKPFTTSYWAPFYYFGA